MATTPTSPVNLSSVVNTLSMSKARLKRRHTATRKDSITNGGTTTNQLITSSEANTIEKENETTLQHRQHSTPSMEETRQDDSLSVARDTPVTSDEDNNPNDLACINITIDYAAPIKAKLLLSFLTMRITFIDNNTGLPIIKSSQTINVVSYYENNCHVMPVMTKTAEIESDKKGRLVARWSEDIVFCESIDHLLQSENVVILLELLILPKIHQSPYPVAWGILLPSKIATFNNKTIPVQLYRIPTRKRTTIKPSELITTTSSSSIYPTLVYIKLTVNDLTVLPVEPSLRSLLPTLPEISINNQHYPLTITREDNSETTDGNSIQWSRLPGQQCAITNKYCGSLMADTSNGCSVTCFSPSGMLLASACINNNHQTVITIHKLIQNVGWELFTTLSCSKGIVYECIWSHDNTLLACASSSGLCHVWRLSDYNELLLPHPSYVYTLQWIIQSSILVTGCYDGAIRCWNTEGKLIEVIIGEGYRINTLCHYNNVIYSGTANGSITVWTINDSMDGGSLLIKDRTMSIPVINGHSIQQLLLIPGGQQRLIVHAINSPYIIIDLRLDSIVVTLTPDEQITHPNALCVTPCGNLLITNNITTTCVWDINKCILIKKYKIRGLKGSLSSITYHPFEHLSVYTAIGYNQRIIMMTNKS